MIFKCPNCNGGGPFLILRKVGVVNTRGEPDYQAVVGVQEEYYMCASTEVNEEGRGLENGCGMVSNQEELTR